MSRGALPHSPTAATDGSPEQTHRYDKQNLTCLGTTAKDELNSILMNKVKNRIRITTPKNRKNTLQDISWWKGGAVMAAP